MRGVPVVTTSPVEPWADEDLHAIPQGLLAFASLSRRMPTSDGKERSKNTFFRPTQQQFADDESRGRPAQPGGPSQRKPVRESALGRSLSPAFFVFGHPLSCRTTPSRSILSGVPNPCHQSMLPVLPPDERIVTACARPAA